MKRLFSISSSLPDVKMPFNKVTHVIFDMDGLLLDTETFYTQVTQSLLDKYTDGAIYSYDVKSTLMGKHREEVAQIIVDYYKLPISYEQYVEESLSELIILMAQAELLPDTEKIYEKLIREIAESYGKTYPFEVRSKLMGTTEKNTAEIAVRDLGLPITTSEFLKMYAEQGQVMLADSELMKGAERLVRHLHAHKIPISVATSSGEDMVAIKTRNHTELFKLFDHKVCGSSDPEVKKGKPAPDIFLISATRFPEKPNPNSCLVFEDAPNGVRGAIAAGMQCVMVPDVNCPDDQRKLASLVLNSLEELNPADFGLPPFDDNS